MTPSELRDLLYEFDSENGLEHNTNISQEIREFGWWWWDVYLDETQRIRLRDTCNSCWGDLRLLDDECLMLAWAVFKM